MSDIGAELLGGGGDAAAIITVAQEACEPDELDASKVYAFRLGDRVEVVNTETYGSTPVRAKGVVTVHDADSLVRYVAKHGLLATEIYANVTTQRLLAVINAHEGAGQDAGWGDHRVTLKLYPTPAWTAWAGANGRLMGQVEFAEQVEERLPDFVTPIGAEMLELAQSFSANRTVRFESSKRLKTGETQLVYKEETEAAAGKRGDIAIPDTFELGLIPFEGADAYKVTARLRYRIEGGHLRIGYVLDRPEDVLRAAFLDIVSVVESGTSKAVLRGDPAA